MRAKVETKNAPQAVGPYSQAIKANGLLFISGQIGLDPQTGLMIATDTIGQTHQVMANIGAILAAEGLTFSDLVKTTIYLTDLGDFHRVNEVYASYFDSDPPARSTVQVASLPKGAKIEIDAIAALR
ncbi:MAG: RidA family protein [Armatimonadota bacterium]